MRKRPWIRTHAWHVVVGASVLLAVLEACSTSSQTSSGVDGGSEEGGLDGTTSCSQTCSDAGSGNESGTSSSSGASSGSSSGGASSGSSGGSSGSDGASDSSSSGSSGGTADGGVVEFASCLSTGPGRSDCGASSENCCTSLQVSGGPFFRTYGTWGPDGGVMLASDGGPGLLADPATISGFRLDKYNVTVGRFRSFVSAWNAGTGWKPPAGSGKHGHLNGGQGLMNSASDAGISYESGWDAIAWNALIAPSDANLAPAASACTWTPSAGTHEDLPINCVNWFEAYAFCIWDGGFLPSEAEWEYAAAAGDEQREYPWGSTAPGTANQYAIYGCYYPSGDAGATCSTGNVAPVGTATLGAGRWGQLDLIGNVPQWSLDWYVPAYVNPCVDCAYLTSPVGTAGPWRVVRGDYFSSTYWSELLPTDRGQNAPTYRGSTFGVRCARTP